MHKDATTPSPRDSCISAIQHEHVAVSAVLTSILKMLDHGPGNHPERFFDVMRAMLFYIDEFPERLHHPKESNLLFPRLARAAPGLLPVIERLEHDHMTGEVAVRALQHRLLAWEILGDTARVAFEQAMREHASFYREHMRIEEVELLPAARKLLGDADWIALDRAFATNRDALAGATPDPRYDRLFTRIVTNAPAPIGVGKDWD
jgi:hemerythrin-like domain-containing protein